MRFPTTSFPLAVGIAVVGVAAVVHAEVMDFDRTASGADTPFSEQIQNTPTPWELFDQPFALTAPTSSQRWVFSEGSGMVLGQLMLAGNVGGRRRWIITDLLAWVPVPQVLYLDPINQIDEPLNLFPSGADYQPLDIGGPLGPAASGRGGRRLPVPEFPPPPVIPSPSTAGIVFVGSLLALCRRR